MSDEPTYADDNNFVAEDNIFSFRLSLLLN